MAHTALRARADDFQIQSLLGKGGFGDVSLAYDARSDMEVALKVVSIERPIALRFFRSECRALWKLQHPNIVRVLDAWDDGRKGYISMELLRGRTLQSVLSNGPLPLDTALAWTETICHALDHAHRLGFVHRDLTPKNVFIADPDGQLKLLDFGFSALSGDNWAARGGTLSYAAPEQWKIAIHHPDARADLYAVGAVLFHMLSGVSLADAPGALLASYENKLTALANLPAPEGVRALIAFLLRDDPADRYQSARGVALDLEALLRNETTLTHQRTRVVEHSGQAIVGRSDELATLERWLEEARHGRGRCARVLAPSGAGKTRLLETWLDGHREPGHVQLNAVCIESHQSTPGALLSAILLDLVMQAELDVEVGAHVRRAASLHEDVLLALQPAMARLFGSGAQPLGAASNDSAEAERQDALAAFFGALSRAAPLGVTLFIDDAQWIDDASLHALLALAEAAKTTRLLIVIGARVEADARLAAASGSALELPPLDRAALSALLNNALGGEGPDHAAALSVLEESAGGNAFVAWETVRAWVEERAFMDDGRGWCFDADKARLLLARHGTDELLARRLSRLPDAARDLLGWAAVWGRRFTLREIACDADALAPGLQAGLIEPLPEAESYAFVHDRIRDSVLKDLSENERRRRHKAVGRQLEAAGDGLLASSHFTEAGELDAAFRAGLAALKPSAGAYEVVKRLVTWVDSGAVVASAGDRQRVFSLLAESALLIGAWQEGIAAYHRVLETPSLSPIERARAYGGQAHAMCRLGAHPRAVGCHEAALAALGVRVPKDGLLLWLLIGWRLFVALVLSVVGPRLPRDDSALRKERVRQLGNLNVTLYYVDVMRCLAVHLHGVCLAERLPPCREQALVWSMHGAMPLGLPMLRARCVRYAERGVAIAVELSDRWAELHARTYRIIARYAVGDFRRMNEEMDSVEQLGRSVRDPALVGMARQHLLYSQACLGHTSDAIDSARQLRIFFQRYKEPLGAIGACFYLPELLATRGDVDEACEIAAWMRRTADAAEIPQAKIQAWAESAHAALAISDLTAARVFVERAQALSRTTQMRNVHTAGLPGLDLCVRAASQQRALSDWRVVLELCVCLGFGPHFRAYNLVALGIWFAARGWRRLARRTFERAQGEARSALERGRASAELAFLRFADCGNLEDAAGLGHLTRAVSELVLAEAHHERLRVDHRWRALGGRPMNGLDDEGDPVTGVEGEDDATRELPKR